MFTNRLKKGEAQCCGMVKDSAASSNGSIGMPSACALVWNHQRGGQACEGTDTILRLMAERMENEKGERTNDDEKMDGRGSE